MVGFLSEARLIAVDAGDLASVNIWEVHKCIDAARLARDWRVPEPFEFGLCVPLEAFSKPCWAMLLNYLGGLADSIQDSSRDFLNPIKFGRV